jgi:hypothetical protein
MKALPKVLSHSPFSFSVHGLYHRAPGKWETIAGIQCYIGTPTVDYPKDKAVLFLPDAMGIQLINNQACRPRRLRVGRNVLNYFP